MKLPKQRADIIRAEVWGIGDSIRPGSFSFCTSLACSNRISRGRLSMARALIGNNDRRLLVSRMVGDQAGCRDTRASKVGGFCRGYRRVMVRISAVRNWWNGPITKASVFSTRGSLQILELGESVTTAASFPSAAAFAPPKERGAPIAGAVACLRHAHPAPRSGSAPLRSGRRPRLLTTAALGCAGRAAWRYRRCTAPSLWPQSAIGRRCSMSQDFRNMLSSLNLQLFLMGC
jgi:hypothetical protein